MKIPYANISNFNGLKSPITFSEVGNKTMGRLVDEIALSGYTNGSQNVVSSAHNLSNAGF